MSGKEVAEQKFCSFILRELTKKSHAPYNLPFVQPVDPIALGIPHYTEVIKEPMDLSTMRRKVDVGEYETLAEFEADMRLMFNNCYTFNPVGTDVYNLGSQLEAVFNSKWAEQNAFFSQYGETGRSRSRPSYDGETSDDDEDDEDAQHIQMLKTQLQLLNTQLQMLTEKRNKRKKRKSMTSTSYAPAAAFASPVAAPKPKKKKSPEKKKQKRPFPHSDDEREPDEVTYEQKRELSDNINILPPELLPKVFEIIKENADINVIFC